MVSRETRLIDAGADAVGVVPSLFLDSGIVAQSKIIHKKTLA